MSDAIRGLQPTVLWEEFSRLLAIPRASHQEHEISAYVLHRASQCGLVWATDAAGNFVVRKPATPGCEHFPVVALQSHVDMVYETRQGAVDDVERTGIRLMRAGDFIMADGTTLGADNGIGVAAAMAVMSSSSIAHGPLEFLFTVNEETGLTGAIALDPALLNSRILINLDSEEDGTLFIGCAGSRSVVLRLPADREAVPSGYIPLSLVLTGLQGGHSGLDIDKVRGNAIRLMARVLWTLAKTQDIKVASITGGTKRNAIPRDAEAVLFVRGERLKAFRDAVDQQNTVLWNEWGSVAEPHLSLAVAPTKPSNDGTVMRSVHQRKILELLYALPTGVTNMSATMPGVVETSLNVGVVRTEGASVVTDVKVRSSMDTAMEDLLSRVAAIGGMVGASVELTKGYPAWTPEPASHILKAVVAAYQDEFGADPGIKSIHGGLECAVIGRKFTGMDMISFGPTIKGAHSPDERVEITSVDRFWRLLLRVLGSTALV